MDSINSCPTTRSNNEENNNDEGNNSEELSNSWTESPNSSSDILIGTKKEKCPHIQYSERYRDDSNVYEYRHVILPISIYRSIPKGRLMSEKEWRSVGIQQSKGWEHYSEYNNQPHTLLFRRPCPPDIAEQSCCSTRLITHKNRSSSKSASKISKFKVRLSL